MSHTQRITGWWSAANSKLDPVPSWAIGLVVAVLGWGPAFAVGSFPGLDVSWWNGLYMAAHDQLQFGREIVFTYGPLGFMKIPWLYYSDLAVISFLYCTVIYLLFSVGLAWSIRRTAGPIVAFAIAFVCVAIVPGFEQALAVAVFASIGILVDRPSDRGLYVYAVAGGFLASAEALMKLSIGPVIFLLLLIGLIGCRPRVSHLVAFGATFVAGFCAFWLIAGQAFSALPDFATNSLQVVAGYNEAMVTLAPRRWDIPVVVAGAVGTLAWAWLAPFEDRRRRIAAGLIVLGVVFASYKQGVIRVDSGHAVIFMSTMLVVWAALPSRPLLAPLKVAGVAAFAAAGIWLLAPPTVATLNPISNVRDLVEQGRMLADADRRDASIKTARAGLVAWNNVDTALVFGMYEKTVSVDPWEITAAWANHLDWDPLPVIQNYTAYTPELDRLNADAIASPDGPERVLRQGIESGVDGRFPAWDPPRQAVATLCNFRPLQTRIGWQVLGRVPDRCGDQVDAGRVDAAPGEQVEVPTPAPDEVVLVRIHGAELSAPQKIISTLYRPPLAYVSDGTGKSYRIVPALASGGLMLRAGRKVEAGRGAFAQIPEMRTIAFDGFGSDLEYEFLRMSVR